MIGLDVVPTHYLFIRGDVLKSRKRNIKYDIEMRQLIFFAKIKRLSCVPLKKQRLVKLSFVTITTEKIHLHDSLLLLLILLPFIRLTGFKIDNVKLN